MSNRNLRYQNGMAKRAAVRQTWSKLRDDGVLLSRSASRGSAQEPANTRFTLDSMVIFLLTGYWGTELRQNVITLCRAQPGLRLFILDTVVSEVRGGGTAYHRRLADEIIFNGHNPEVGVVRPLRSDTAAIGRLTSRILASRPDNGHLPSPSDHKDALIAAASISYRLTLLTRNRDDFAAIAAREPGLRYVALEGGEANDLLLGAQLLEALAAPFLARAPR